MAGTLEGPHPLERAARVRRILELGAEIRARVTLPLSTPNHDWLYGDDGLPLDSWTDFSKTDIEPALKD